MQDNYGDMAENAPEAKPTYEELELKVKHLTLIAHELRKNIAQESRKNEPKDLPFEQF